MRTNKDSWTITSSVGRTALLVALGRALETRRPDALIRDRFAEAFVRAAGEDSLTPEAIDELVDSDPSVAGSVTMLRDMMAARTLRIDTAVADATASGCAQAVILASGLDARAHRLPWASGTPVFEVDQPAVLEFKNGVLDQLDAQTAAHRTTVACDLRDDWLGALRDAGFREDIPTVWLAEGLLPYLRAEDQQTLLTTIGSAAPSGSVLILDVPREPFEPDHADFDASAFGVTMDELFFDIGQFATQDWLDGHGWATTSDSLVSLLSEYGRPAPEGSPWTRMQQSLDLVVAHRR
ncbi:SAM-dependent methyltransferase [Williamsia herbipolensis]|uniref:SAM-dependent methyltransferase n=1 Tax=Williamsia herbipolensis TaxID=1603258 RepID=UPI0005F80561|nr:SAM-dependent methyltransferase [Williamsia herbipolensis]